MSKNRAEGSAVELVMIGDNNLGEWIVAPENHVTARLAAEREADAGKGANTFPAGDARESAHTATTNVSKRSSGTGRLSCSRAAI